MKNILFSFFFIVAFAGQTNAQKTLSDFKSKQFKTAELTLGSGTRFLGSLTANLNLQKNISVHADEGLSATYPAKSQHTIAYQIIGEMTMCCQLLP